MSAGVAATAETISANGVLLNGVPALQSQTSLNNYYSGGAGNLTGTGYNNTANGFQALLSNTTGNNNTANGLYALHSNTTGYNNTANGFQALYANTTGNNNTANGMYALYQHHRLLQHREWVQALSTTPPAPTTPRMGIRRDNTSRMA